MRLREYPGLLPGLALTIFLAFTLSARLGRALGSNRTIAWGLLFGFGLIVSATLTPGREALRFGESGSGSCDLGRIGLASIGEILTFGETGLNVALFMPLGFAIRLLPRGRIMIWIIASAVAFPFVIEATQLILTPLGRRCQSADVIDNLSGLLLGFALGSLASILLHRRRLGADETSD